MKRSMKWLLGNALASAITLMFVPSAFCANPVNCLDVLIQSGEIAQDGEYIIEPLPGRTFPVYCKDMQVGGPFLPKEYLTLQRTGGDYNYSQYTVGQFTWGTNVRSQYSKVRIDPSTLLIDIADGTFATTTGEVCSPYGCFAGPVGYGVAMDSTAPDSHTGVANIDLTGTPFIVSDIFFATGYRPAGSVTFNGRTINLPPNLQVVVVNGKTVDITGGGYAGAVGPQGYASTYDMWMTPSATKLSLNLKYVGQP